MMRFVLLSEVSDGVGQMYTRRRLWVISWP